MNDQIKYGFKKEWSQYTRTFRLGGVILGIFSFALADPLMYKLLNVMMELMSQMPGNTNASINIDAGGYGEAMEIAAGMLNDAGMIFSMTMNEFCATSVLIVMLILMSASGGEQKKRATIIPSCCGLKSMNYLIPKFILYPLSVFGITFVSVLCAGGLCNMMFTENPVSVEIMFLGALLTSIFVTFIITVYMAIGLCTSRPGLVTVLVYIGMSIVMSVLQYLELDGFNPFTLRIMIAGQITSEYFSLEDNALSMIVGIMLSFVIMVMMFFLTYAVLNAKKINNREDKPEF